MMLFLLAAMAASGDSPADAAIGLWQTEVRHGLVEISRCGQSLCGKIVDSDGLKANPALLDTKNKDPKLRARPLKGMTILKGFSWRGNAWSGGTIYNAEDGGTYNATITIADTKHLKLKGCVVWPLCKTQTWTRLR